MSTEIIRVLLVEDDEDDYFLARDVIDSIDRMDYEIFWCDTFDKAFDALKKQSFNVALVDYRIGGQTGIDFLKVAKEDGVDVPMILLTGLQDHEIDIAASEAGAADYLNKGELGPAVVERAIRFACANADTQRALAERSALLQTTLDNTGSGLAALDADAKLVAYNQRFCKQICQLGPRIGPVALRASCGSVDPDALQFAVGELLRGLNIEENGHSELGTIDGAILDLSRNKTEAGGSVIVVRDITEQRFFEQNLTRAKDDAEAASRAKTAFLATMSHELRTPLNAIIGFSDLILSGTRGQLEPEAYREYISDIHDSGRHLLGIITEILDFAKAEAGTAEINKEELHLPSELEFCMRLMMSHAEKSGVTLQPDFQGFSGYIFADQTAFRRILINILSNSIKFTPEAGHVRLSVDRLDDGALAIGVTDTGIGIAEEDLPLVVQPFYQVHSEIETPYEGTGLGLSIVNSLAQLHEASLKIESVFGKGTTVTLDFPEHTVKAERSEASSKQVAV